MRQKTEYPEPVVDGERDDAAAGESGAVVARLGSVARGESAAVEIHEHGQPLGRPGRRRPHVQVQTVLADARGSEHYVRLNAALYALVAEVRRSTRLNPLRDGLRRLPAER